MCCFPRVALGFAYKDLNWFNQDAPSPRAAWDTASLTAATWSVACLVLRTYAKSDAQELMMRDNVRTFQVKQHVGQHTRNKRRHVFAYSPPFTNELRQCRESIMYSCLNFHTSDRTPSPSGRVSSSCTCLKNEWDHTVLSVLNPVNGLIFAYPCGILGSNSRSRRDCSVIHANPVCRACVAYIHTRIDNSCKSGWHTHSNSHTHQKFVIEQYWANHTPTNLLLFVWFVLLDRAIFSFQSVVCATDACSCTSDDECANTWVCGGGNEVVWDWGSHVQAYRYWYLLPWVLEN